MAQSDKDVLTPCDLLAGPPDWLKDAKPWDKIVGDNEIIFEDAHVVVFADPIDDDGESERLPGEVRATLLCKKHVHSLMDLGVADEHLNAKILHAIQQAAYRLGLEHKGFEVRAHVYPPMQHRPELAFKIRSGKPPHAASAANPQP